LVSFVYLLNIKKKPYTGLLFPACEFTKPFKFQSSLKSFYIVCSIKLHICFL